MKQRVPYQHIRMWDVLAKTYSMIVGSPMFQKHALAKRRRGLARMNAMIDRLARERERRKKEIDRKRKYYKNNLGRRRTDSRHAK